MWIIIILSCFVLYCLVILLSLLFVFPLLVLLGSFPFFSLPPSLSSLYRSVPAPSWSYSPNQSSILFTPVPYLALWLESLFLPLSSVSVLSDPCILFTVLCLCLALSCRVSLRCCVWAGVWVCYGRCLPEATYSLWSSLQSVLVTTSGISFLCFVYRSDLSRSIAYFLYWNKDSVFAKSLLGPHSPA
jgi:hypothetical protein